MHNVWRYFYLKINSLQKVNRFNSTTFRLRLLNHVYLTAELVVEVSVSGCPRAFLRDEMRWKYFFPWIFGKAAASKGVKIRKISLVDVYKALKRCLAVTLHLFKINMQCNCNAPSPPLSQRNFDGTKIIQSKIK